MRFSAQSAASWKSIVVVDADCCSHGDVNSGVLRAHQRAFAASLTKAASQGLHVGAACLACCSVRLTCVAVDRYVYQRLLGAVPRRGVVHHPRRLVKW